MSQESLHSLGDSEVMLGARPKDKHLEAPEQLVETWERPSSRLEMMICNLAKSTQSIQQSMTEQIHDLQQQFTQTMTEQSQQTYNLQQQTHKFQQQMTTQTQQIKQHQAEAEHVLAKVVRSQTDLSARLIRIEGSTPTEEMKGETDPGEIRSTYSAVPSRSTAPSPTHATSYTATLDFIAPCPTDTGHLLSQPPKTGLATRWKSALMRGSKVGGVAASTTGTRMGRDYFEIIDPDSGRVRRGDLGEEEEDLEVKRAYDFEQTAVKIRNTDTDFNKLIINEGTSVHDSRFRNASNLNFDFEERASPVFAALPKWRNVRGSQEEQAMNRGRFVSETWSNVKEFQPTVVKEQSAEPSRAVYCDVQRYRSDQFLPSQPMYPTVTTTALHLPSAHFARPPPHSVDWLDENQYAIASAPRSYMQHAFASTMEDPYRHLPPSSVGMVPASFARSLHPRLYGYDGTPFVDYDRSGLLPSSYPPTLPRITSVLPTSVATQTVAMDTNDVAPLQPNTTTDSVAVVVVPVAPPPAIASVTTALPSASVVVSSTPPPATAIAVPTTSQPAVAVASTVTPVASATVPSSPPSTNPPPPPFVDRRNQIKIGTYSGDGSLMQYLRRFDTAAKQNGWSESDKLNILLCSLVGEAAHLVWEDSADDIDSVDELIKRLKNRFGTEGEESLHLTELNMRRQKSSESITVVYNDIKRLLTLAFPGKANHHTQLIATKAFLDSLLDRELANWVAIQCPKTVEEAFKMSLKIHAIRQSEAEKAKDRTWSRGRIQHVRESDNNQNKVTKKLGQLVENLERSLHAASDVMTGYPQPHPVPHPSFMPAYQAPPANVYPHQPTSAYSWQAPTRQPKHQKNRHCYVCTSGRHFSNQCPHREETIRLKKCMVMLKKMRKWTSQTS